MKNALIISLCCVLTFGSVAQSALPCVDVKDESGNIFNTSNITNDGNPVIIVFWADWSQNSLDYLSSLVEKYHGWQKNYKLKIYSVMVGRAVKITDLSKFVDDQKWPWVVLQDQTEYFRATMQCRTFPETYIVNGKNQIVWHRNGFLHKDGISAVQDELKKLRVK